MSVKFVSGLAIGFGFITILTCFMIAPMIFSDIQRIHIELTDEMQIFKVTYLKFFT